MYSPLILEIVSNFPANIRKDMENLSRQQNYRAIWQTIEWQLMLHETGYTQKSFFVGIYEERVLVSYAILEKRSIGLGQYGLFCIGGPIFSSPPASLLLTEKREAERNIMKILGNTLEELTKKENVVFVQVESLVPIALDSFRQGEYKHFLEKHTALIDLSQDDETILSRMKPKGRYNIRVAEKAGVRVEQVSPTDENLDIFYGLLSETLERDGFAANSREYFRVFLQYLEKYELGGLFFATREGETIAGGIFVFAKNTALYYYGASSSDNGKRKYMATYLLQWHAIRVAKERGCQVFDFLGIADPMDTDSPLAGVTDFKLKLTNETRAWPDSQILVTRKFIYLILIIRKKLKKIFSRRG